MRVVVALALARVLLSRTTAASYHSHIAALCACL